MPSQTGLSSKLFFLSCHSSSFSVCRAKFLCRAYELFCRREHLASAPACTCQLPCRSSNSRSGPRHADPMEKKSGPTIRPATSRNISSRRQATTTARQASHVGARQAHASRELEAQTANEGPPGTGRQLSPSSSSSESSSERDSCGSISRAISEASRRSSRPMNSYV